MWTPRSSTGGTRRSDPAAPSFRCPRLTRRFVWLGIAVLIPAVRLTAAFEGADLFRTSALTTDAIYSPALGNPAFLPADRAWFSAATGRPLGLPWAAFNTAAVGLRLGPWRGALGAWSSGDALYRETVLAVSGARVYGERLVVAAGLAYNQVAVRDLDHFADELLVSAAFRGRLTERLEFSLWYSGQPLRREEAWTSLGRQLFQLVLFSRPGNGPGWSLAVEKTPGFEMRHLAAVELPVWNHLNIELGYRTGPGVPHLGAVLRLGRLAAHLRLVYHPIFGLSPAVGFSSP